MLSLVIGALSSAISVDHNHLSILVIKLCLLVIKST